MFTLHAVPGPLQKVGAAQALPLQTPEQQTPPLVVEQAVPVVRQVLPGPPSLSPPSGTPPSSLLVGLGPPQLHAANVYPITSATENTNSDFLILLLRLCNQEKKQRTLFAQITRPGSPAYSSTLKLTVRAKIVASNRRVVRIIVELLIPILRASNDESSAPGRFP